MIDPTRGLVPPEGSYEDRLAQLAADAAPELTADQVDLLRARLGPAFQGHAEVASIVALPVTVDSPEAPGVAA